MGGGNAHLLNSNILADSTGSRGNQVPQEY